MKGLPEALEAQARGGEIVLEGTPEIVFSRVETLAGGNIRPPLLAEMFRRLGELDPSAPPAALTVGAAADALVRWKQGA